MGTFSEKIIIKASPDAVWETLAEIGSIDQWNPGVVASEKTTPGDVGLGAGRHCQLGGKNYLDETVVKWTPGEALTMRITSTNLPFETADIRFTLEKTKAGSIVTVSPSYTLRFGWIGKVMDAVFVRSQYKKGMANLLTGLKRHVEDVSNREDR